MNESALDELMARLDPAMIIVTTTAEDERAGCLVGFHSQSGMAPDTFAVWLSKANHTYLAATKAEHFAVHLLADDDHDLAELFGTSCGAEVDKFERCSWEPGPDGVPLLDRCPNRFVGTKLALVDTGSDHVCLVLDPISADLGQDLHPLRLSDVTDLEPGHLAGETPPH